MYAGAARATRVSSRCRTTSGDCSTRDAGPAAVSLFLLRRLARSGDAPRRAARNYARLHAQLADFVAPGFEGIDDESCPFAFPIATTDKHGLIAALAAEGSKCSTCGRCRIRARPTSRRPWRAARRRSGCRSIRSCAPQDVDRIADADARVPARRPPPGRRRRPARAGRRRRPRSSWPTRTAHASSLAAHAGKNVVLYFYPEADTPGCTAQACALRDARAGFRDENAVVLGVSPDSEAKLHAFANEYGLPFTLLADEGHRVADAYGVWRGDANERTTFLIGPDGTVRRVFRNVDPEHHDALVLAELRTTRALAVEA